MDVEGARNSETQIYTANLDSTLKELQRKVRDHQAELERIRASQSESPLSPEDQANVIRDALDNVNNSEPFLPFAGSALPALLALRRAHQTIDESRVYLGSHGPQAERERKQLETDRANLRDQQLLTDALSSRAESLRRELQVKADMRPEDSAREKMDDLRAKKKSYDRETSKLMRALLGFIDNQLAPMLAAEELGGPVVGDIIEVDPDELAAGFDAQGKLKKARGGAGEDRRQRRIDEMLGSRRQPLSPRVDGEDEIAAARTEMRELTEELLNRLVEAKGDNSASYVTLERESAASRFLVRSKVAQLHTKDANKLRLIDFGRDLEN